MRRNEIQGEKQSGRAQFKENSFFQETAAFLSVGQRLQDGLTGFGRRERALKSFQVVSVIEQFRPIRGFASTRFERQGGGRSLQCRFLVPESGPTGGGRGY